MKSLPLWITTILVVLNGSTTSGQHELSDAVAPEWYEIHLIPDLVNFSFTGQSTIFVNVVEPTSLLKMHSNELTVTKIVIYDNRSNLIEYFSPGDTKHVMYLSLRSTLIKNQHYRIHTEFNGTLNEEPVGFYRFPVHDGNTVRWSAATNFDPHHASRAFPCWDEPPFTAEFSITIEHSVNLTAISNMPVFSTSPVITDERRIRTTFQRTPRISTYRVAFMIVEHTMTMNENETFSMWTDVPTKSSKYILDNSETLISRFATYAGIDRKNIGIIRAAATHVERQPWVLGNLGLITFDASKVLTPEAQSKANGIGLIMRGIVLQYFGDKQKIYWWNELWMHEGFASYFQYVLTDKFKPEWRYKDLGILQSRREAFQLDSSADCLAMDSMHLTPYEIRTTLNSIMIDKAWLILRTIAHILGEDKFKEVVKQYVTNSNWGDRVNPEKLFAIIHEVCSTTSYLQNVKVPADPRDIMADWTETAGFPVITVDTQYGPNQVRITQKRYVQSPDVGNQRYYVPLNYATQEMPSFENTYVTHWMDKDKDELLIEGDFNKDQWVIFNKQQIGYYRVNYDEKNWKLLADALLDNHTVIHPLNRAQLIDDAINLASTGQLEWDITKQVLQYLKNENDPAPWYAALPLLLDIQKKLSQHQQSLFKDYISKLTDAAMSRLGPSDSSADDALTQEVRRHMIDLACAVGSENCRNHGLRTLLSNADYSVRKISSRIRKFNKMLLCAGTRSANLIEWEELQSKYQNYAAFDHVDLLRCVQDREVLDQELRKAMGLTHHETTCEPCIKAIMDNEKGVDAVLDFIDTHEGDPNDVLGSFWFDLEDNIDYLGKSITDISQLMKLENTSNNAVKRVSRAAIEDARQRLLELNLFRSRVNKLFDVPVGNSCGFPQWRNLCLGKKELKQIGSCLILWIEKVLL